MYHGVPCPAVVCVGVKNFWLFLIVLAPVSCLKLLFLRQAIMGCKLWNIFIKIIADAQYVPVFVYYFLNVWQHWTVCYRKWYWVFTVMFTMF